MTQQKVTAPQFFSLLYLSVLSSVFMYISSPRVPIARTETLLQPIVFIAVSLVCGIPAVLIYNYNNKYAEKGFILKETPAFRLITSVFGLVYFVGALKTILRFDLFTSSELFPGTDMSFFIIAIVIVCGFLSVMGLGALCRGSVVFCFIVVGATVFVMLSLLDDFSFLNFTPLFTEGYGKFWGDSFLFSVQATEIGAISFFLPQIKGDFKKHYTAWVLLSALTFVGVLAFVIGSLGYFADTQLFPTYTAVTLANFGLLERIDSLETAIWIFCVVVKISLYIHIIVLCLKNLFRKASIITLSAVVCVLLSAIPALVSNNIELFGFVSNKLLTIILYSIAVVVHPLAVLIYIKKVRPYEKISEDI